MKDLEFTYGMYKYKLTSVDVKPIAEGMMTCVIWVYLHDGRYGCEIDINPLMIENVRTEILHMILVRQITDSYIINYERGSYDAYDKEYYLYAKSKANTSP